MELLDKQKRILVLDKDSRILSVVDEIMNYGDWDVKTIYDPYAVYDIAKSYQPDLIILDYLLLDNDCALICQDFKDDTQLQNLPIIVVTAYKTKKQTPIHLNATRFLLNHWIWKCWHRELNI